MQIIDAPQSGEHEHLIKTLSSIMVQINALQAITNTEAHDAAPDMHTIRSGLAALEQQIGGDQHGVQRVLQVMADRRDDILAHVNNPNYRPVKPKVIAKKIGAEDAASCRVLFTIDAEGRVR